MNLFCHKSNLHNDINLLSRQLFSVGLYKLHSDGTRQVNVNSTHIYTYDSDDIVDIACIWTGFDRSLCRDNLFNSNGRNNTNNMVDPLQMRPSVHD